VFGFWFIMLDVTGVDVAGVGSFFEFFFDIGFTFWFEGG
jgi:hypothetical protein